MLAYSSHTPCGLRPGELLTMAPPTPPTTFYEPGHYRRRSKMKRRGVENASQNALENGSPGARNSVQNGSRELPGASREPKSIFDAFLTLAGVAPGGLLGPSWRFLGRSCRVLGSSWRFLGPSWASRDAPRRVPGRVSEAVWGDVFGALPRSLKNRRFHKLWVAFSVFFVKSFLEPLLSSLRLRRRGRKPLKYMFSHGVCDDFR